MSEDQKPDNITKVALNPDEDSFRNRIGTMLSQARKEKKIGLVKAATDLKLSKSYIEALESGDWSVLPGKFYARGFLRVYGTYLDVDIQAEIETLRTEGYRLTKPHTIPDPPIAPKREWALAAGIVFLLLFLLFNIFENRYEDESSVPAEQPLQTKGNQ